MGTADAGLQAWADNASTALHNPAGMTRLKSSSVLIGAGFGATQVEFDADRSVIRGNNGGDAGAVAPLGTISGVWKIDDRWAAGLDAGGITGASLNYDRNWVGRFQVDDVSLMVLGVTPSVAYKVTDWLSLGAGATLWYANLDQTIRPSQVDGDARIKIDDADDTDATFKLSTLFSLSEQTRLGVVYNSEAELKLSGDITLRRITEPFNAGLDFVFPQYVKAGIYHDLTDRLALLASVRWEDWSSFDEIPVSTDRGSAAIPTNWHDTYGFSGRPLQGHGRPPAPGRLWLRHQPGPRPGSACRSAGRSSTPLLARRPVLALRAAHAGRLDRLCGSWRRRHRCAAVQWKLRQEPGNIHGSQSRMEVLAGCMRTKTPGPDPRS
ncbi:MAG TPA: outer membrane protein transport protein [Geminicoccus sp.]|uniref:OmpP1/FadL family transporter n=1 Tax=Geminicoccus sp. TaxID=2024832 RepID=UPI002E36153D|nr:outer membrane protein transport protein [Geminicoccus sp.]HEX2528547.1 outer membrane protein transport protein [Geminicoccus sp.]